jgi:hypothetical protein
MIAEIGGLWVSIRGASIPGDSLDEQHSEWFLERVRLFCIHSFRRISWMSDMTTGESLLLDDLQGAATTVPL